MGQTNYILTTCLVILMTAVIPFYLSCFLAKKVSSPSCYLVASLMPLVLSGIGLAIYFYLFIAPSAPSVEIAQVLPRAFLPGIAMGAILVGALYSKKND
jgi:hypothetical protein